MSGYCSLQASSRAVERAGAMHLAERGGRGGMMLEACELALPVGPELGVHPPLDEGPAHRRRFALQLLQFGRVFRRQEIGNGRHQLGDLHQRTFEIAERRGERRRLAGAIRLAAEKPPARIARRHAADIGADARVARGAGGEAVLFTIGHQCSDPICYKRHIGRMARAMKQAIVAGAGRAFGQANEHRRAGTVTYLVTWPASCKWQHSCERIAAR